MHKFPDEDTQLVNFLRQNRSIAPTELPKLEDRLISEIDLLHTNNRSGVSRDWLQYIMGGVGLVAVGIVGLVMHQTIEPPAPSMAQLQELNLYLESYATELVTTPSNLEDRDNLVDLDIDIFMNVDNDTDDG
jgi:hypothetical protein